MNHPGNTPAQRRALDEIGCGNFSPVMAPRTREALLKAGLIEPCGHKLVGEKPFQLRVDEYQMPLPVHKAWCDHQSEEWDKLPEEEKRREMEPDV